MIRVLLALMLIIAPCVAPARAADIVDATGRTVTVPDQILRVLPAGPAAAVLLAAIAPDLMLGWPHVPEGDAAAMLPPALARLPAVPVLTGGEDVIAGVAALHPDLILDYGSTTPRYTALAEATQTATGIPTMLLDGNISLTPLALRILGRVLHREARGEELARLAEGVLAGAPFHHQALRVVYVRGDDGAAVAVPRGNNSELEEFLGWTVLAPPPPQGSPPGAAFRPASVAQIAALDPDLILFSSAAMRGKIAESAEWRSVRAVREHHAWIAPSAPFGWVDEPPSLNRLLGLAWLGGGTPDPGIVPLAAVFQAVVYGRTPTPAQIDTLRAALAPIEP